MLITVVGSGHSATTLVATILGAHKDLHLIPTETHYFLRNPVGIEQGYTRADFTASKYGKLGVIEKTPHNLLVTEEIKKQFPNVKIISTVRDYRDILASRKAGSAGKTSPEQLLKVFERLITLKNEDKSILFIKYDDLIEDLEAECRRMCDFLGLDFDDQMLRYYEVNHSWFRFKDAKPQDKSTVSGFFETRAWQVRQPIFDRRGIWKDSLTEEDLKPFESIHQQYLDTFGYKE